jgi:Ca-activated chloride channel family protein
MRGRIIVIALAVAGVVIAAIVSLGGGGNGSSSGGGGTTSPKPPAGSLAVRFAYSPEKAALLQPLIREFNAKGVKVGGRAVFIQAVDKEDGGGYNSGDAEHGLATQRLALDAWSPAGSFWGRLLNYQTDQALVPDANPSIVRTPLVFAMWRQLAQALGYPRKKVGYADILKLATAPGGWASVGHPEFGRFKYVHTNPDSSTSGAEAVTAAYYAFAGKKEGLTEADVRKTAPQVKQVESSIVHYGDSTLFIADQMCEHGIGYASAVAMEETTLLDLNRRRGCSGDKLVAIYPTEGSFFSDSPLITLNRGKAAAVQAFSDFLAGKVTPELAGQYGFRPGDPAKKPGGRVTAANGVNPAQPARVLTLPEPKVLNRLLVTWRRDRKPANVLLVLDVSGSMGDSHKLDNAKQGLQTFLRQTAPQDRVGLTTFSSSVTPIVPVRPFARNRQALSDAVKGLVPQDETAVYDATIDAVNRVKASSDPRYINAVVILTDGEDTSSSNGSDDVIARLRQENRSESGGVRVFTIAYGDGANRTLLAQFSAASGGKAFIGSTQDIESVYRSISSFF